MVSAIKSSFQNVNSKARKIFNTVSLAVVSANTSVYAGNYEDTAEALVGNFINVIFFLFRMVGILLLAWSVAQLVMAFKNEDADSKTRSITLIVISVLLIALKSIFNGLGVITIQ